MKIWTTEQEAEALAKRFEGENRAAFARAHKIAGGQAMIYQHIKGLRPINLEAALAYADGFGCALAEISPRLAKDLQNAAARSDGSSKATTPKHARSVWPFSAPFEAYEALDDEKKRRLDERVSDFLAGAAPSKKTVTPKKAA